jgi:hypothetical protein
MSKYFPAPWKRTLLNTVGMSQTCHERAHALQQTASLIDHFTSTRQPFFFLRGYIEIGRSRSALPMAAPSEKLNGGAQLDYGKATVGYIVHRISRVNLKNMFKESGTPCPNFATLFSPSSLDFPRRLLHRT